MWTAKITSKKHFKGAIEVGVTYSDESDMFWELYNVTNLELLESLIKDKLRILSQINSEFDLIIMDKDYNLIQKTQDEIDIQNYLELKNKWNRLQEDIKEGLIKIDDLSVVQLQTDLKNAYKPSYSGL